MSLIEPTESCCDLENTFRIEKSPWDTWSSYDKNGAPLITSLTKEICESATLFYLRGKKDGFPKSDSSYDGSVGGKL